MVSSNKNELLKLQTKGLYQLQTGGSTKFRIKEHQRNTKPKDVERSAVAKHLRCNVMNECVINADVSFNLECFFRRECYSYNYEKSLLYLFYSDLVNSDFIYMSVIN